uniref:Mitochondrial inner membrane protease ATP23 n=1 Tax=Calcidiscus leptoporus TaxID=127549 RepID=A0A7S0II36_9EUKA|mmetsp:Transcript_10596/g.24557  ORF Transcript_10596/g.24557 Transcript_10596/m.24557 type:complete len:202 (+) Transcript_10596:71-676(+)
MTRDTTTGSSSEPAPEAAIQHGVCTSLVNKALSGCPKVFQLRQALEALGADVPIECIPCPEPGPGETAVAGGYMPATGSVVLCQEWVAQQTSEVPNTLAHELVHAYDDARAHMDWFNLTHHACTEIRAAQLSGDCSFGRELDRSNINPLRIAKAGERCVRRRAQLSVAMNPVCSSALAAEDAVKRAWNICAKDFAPFEKVP